MTYTNKGEVSLQLPASGSIIQREFFKNFKPKKSHGVMATSILALSVSGCGGGGSSQGNSSESTTQPSNSSSSVNSFPTAPSLPPSGSLLSLSKLGANYVTSTISGFTLKDGSSHYIVADDTQDNLYAVKLDAEGAGTLEFEFEDSNDTIELKEGSVISGFSQLNVKNGTVDATLADLGGVDTIVVASSIKITYKQVTGLKSLVSNSATSSFEIEVENEEEAKALEELIESDVLEILGGDGKIEVVAAPEAVATVPPAVITSVVSSVAAVVSAAPPAPAAVVAPPVPKTLLIQDEVGSVSIENNDNFVNKSESGSQIKITVDLENNHSVKSIKLGGVNMSATSNAGEYSISVAAVGQGEKDLVIEIIDDFTIQNDPEIFGGVITLQSQITVDTIDPESAQISIEGEENGLNAQESTSNIGVTVIVQDGEKIDSVSVGGVALSKNSDGSYRLDGTSLNDGSHNVEVITSDQAGNTRTTQKQFTVDASSPSEALISVSGMQNGLNASEASGLVNVTLDLNGAASVQSLTLSGQPLQSGSSNLNYTFDASALQEGAHQITAVTVDSAGNSTTATQIFSIDRTAPTSAEITVSNASFGLRPEEMVDPVLVLINPAIDATISSATISGNQMSNVAPGQYQFNGNALGAGRHNIVITTQDSSGNSTTTTEEVTILGFTSSIADTFEFRTIEKANGNIQIDAYVKNISTSLLDGIENFDFDILLEATALDYIEGSFEPYAGATYAVGESSSASGVVRVAGYSTRKFYDYTEPFATFEARDLNSSETTQISFINLEINRVDFDTITLFTDI